MIRFYKNFQYYYCYNIITRKFFFFNKFEGGKIRFFRPKNAIIKV